MNSHTIFPLNSLTAAKKSTQIPALVKCPEE